MLLIITDSTLVARYTAAQYPDSELAGDGLKRLISEGFQPCHFPGVRWPF